MSDPLARAIFGDDRGAEAISRRQRRRAPRPPAKRTGRKVLVLFVALALVTGAGVAAFTVPSTTSTPVPPVFDVPLWAMPTRPLVLRLAPAPTLIRPLVLVSRPTKTVASVPVTLSALPPPARLMMPTPAVVVLPL